MAAIIAYTFVVAVLIAAGARALEELARSIGAPRRFIWMAAMVGTLVLAIAAPYRSGGSEASQAVLSPIPNAGFPPIPSAIEAGASERLQGLPDLVQTALHRTLEALVSVAGAIETELLIGGWALFSSLLALVGLRTLTRYRTARRGWPVRRIDGVSVRISPNAGPAVLGIVRPEIVVPGWFLGAPDDERRLMLLHEREHLRARDPLMLAAGSIAVVIAPWVLPLWWMHRRLRLAVEVDCDARVLRHGVPRREYGSMLIDVAGRGSSLSAGVAAFSGPSSNLEKRLLALTTNVRGISAKGASWGAVGVAVLLTACAADLPTNAEIERMDVAAVENAAEQLMLIDSDTDVVGYYLDGEEITAEEARAIPASRIAAVEVIRATESEGARSIRLTSATPADGSSGEGLPGGSETGTPNLTGNLEVRAVDPADGQPVAGGRIEGVVSDPESLVSASEPVQVRGYAASGAGETIAQGRPQSMEALYGSQAPLVVIDGVQADASAFGNLRPTDIESISVLKDASAAVYSSEGVNGIILVTTRDRASQ